MRDGKWEYTVRVFAPTNQGGRLLLEVTLAHKSALDMEVDVCRTRMKKGEVGYFEVISHVEPYGVERFYT